MPKPSQPGAMTPGPELDALITERWNRFESAHKIADATRLSSGFIRKQLARLQAEGVELRPAGLPGMYVRPPRPRPEAEVWTDRDALLKRAQSEQGWTPARSAWASMRFGSGVPASRVALELGGGITRSAVIGHLNRKGVSRSVSALIATRSARKPAPKCAPVRIEPKTPAARAAMSPVPKPPRPLPVEVPSPANAKPLMQRGHGECVPPPTEDPQLIARVRSENGWTDARIDYACQRWKDGASATEIAAEMGGATRNSVIGLVHRRGLARPATATQSAQRAAAARPSLRRRQFNPVKVPLSPPPPEPAREPVVEDILDGTCTLVELNDARCRWPIGDPAGAETSFCGRRAGGEGPYCLAHHKVAYHPQKKRDRANAQAISTRRLRGWP